MILTKTDKTIKAFEKEIKRLLKEGKTAKEAVKEAYKKYPVMKTLEKELQKQLEEEMKRGAGEEIPITAIHDALSLSWSPDKLTLSERTTKGGKEITAQAASIIAETIKKGESVQKTALALFDGYGYGHILPTQDIPEFMKKLTEIGKLTDYKGQEFRKTLRAVERQLKRVNVQGMKIAYGKIKEAIETGNEKKINKAVYVATQERTRYFARRIARTELARAYGDGAMAKWENDEDCVAFQWKLSSGHPCYDICDLYANADLYGMGKGIFPKDKVPRLPAHPNCMCHLRPVMEGSRLLQGEGKEQINKGGMAYIKKLSKHDQERLLGVHGRLEVLKRGNWTEKARGYSSEKMKSRLPAIMVTSLNTVNINGNEYRVDGKHVFLAATENEREIAKLLSQELDTDICLVPQVMYPPGIRTPDYLIYGVGYDLKTPVGSGKATIYDMLRHGKGQARRFIVDANMTKLSIDEIISQVERAFTSNWTKFIDEVIVVKDGSIKYIHKR